LDDRFLQNRKVMEAGLQARMLYIASLCHCAGELTDGFIPTVAVAKMASQADVRGAGRAAARLVAVGLWEQAPGGFRVHDYLEYNPSRADVLAERSASRERVNAWRKAKRGSGGNGVRTPLVTAHVRTPRPMTHDPTHDPEDRVPASRDRPAPQPTGGGARADPAPVSVEHEALLAALVQALNYAAESPQEEAEWHAAVDSMLARAEPVTPDEVPRLLSEYEATRSDAVPRTPRALARAVAELRRRRARSDVEASANGRGSDAKPHARSRTKTHPDWSYATDTPRDWTTTNTPGRTRWDDDVGGYVEVDEPAAAQGGEA
jgi:hypothetical protein